MSPRPSKVWSTVVKLVIAGSICLYPRCLQQALSPLIHFWVLFRDNHSITGHMHEELHDALDIVTKMGSVSHENPKMHYSNSHASGQKPYPRYLPCVCKRTRPYVRIKYQLCHAWSLDTFQFHHPGFLRTTINILSRQLKKQRNFRINLLAKVPHSEPFILQISVFILIVHVAPLNIHTATSMGAV